MKHVAAYALLVLGGNTVPEPDQVAALLKEAGVTADKAQIEALSESFKGKKFHEIVAEGLSKMGSVSASAGPAAAVVTDAKEPEKEPEAEKEPSEESADVEMGGLFGGDDDDY